GAEIALVHTPGIHRPHFRMNAAMVRDATDALATADLVLWLVDASENAAKGEEFIFGLLEKVRIPAILVLNKIDLVEKEKLLPLIARFAQRREFAEIVPVSARTGDGVERLAGLVARHLPERGGAYAEDVLTSTPETEWIWGFIREKLLDRTRDELPFASAVLVDSVEENEERGVTVVTASIVVEKEGQKGIVVGKGGAMIRDI